MEELPIEISNVLPNLFNALKQGSTEFKYAMVLSRKQGKKAEMERLAEVDEDLLDQSIMCN